MPPALSHVLAAVLGGIVVAVVLVLAGIGDDGGSDTVFESGSGDVAEAPKGALTPRAIYRRDAPGVVFVRARVSDVVGEGTSSGSGFVFGRGGSILTNAHVVGDAKRVTVRFSDSKIAVAKVAGADPSTDLALLLVDPDGLDLHALELGSSKRVAVGDSALAIGNPFGLERTLTTGVISAVHRRIPSLQEGFLIGNALETDAAINPGNSGGPLIDARGRVIGVNAQIRTNGTDAGNIGIGFAVPIDTAKEVIPRLRKEGRIERAYLGVVTRSVDKSLDRLDLPVKDGALVQTVQRGSPAARAGIRPGTRATNIGGDTVLVGGDIIRAVGGKPVKTNDDVAELISARRPGESVKITIVRGDDTRVVTVKLGRRPSG